MNYRPWGYEPHGLTWLPHPASTKNTNYNLINSPTPTPIEKGPTTMPDKRTRKIVEERISILFKAAEEAFHTDPDRSQYYVDMARRIAMRSRVHIPPQLRGRVCSKCKAYLMPGSTSRTRIRKRREPHVATTCLKCGHVHRVPLRSRQL